MSENNDQVYSDQYCQQQYECYLQLFQQRYALAYLCSCKKCITWAKIATWRRHLNHYGGILIERKLLSVRDHLRNKAEVLTCIPETGANFHIDQVRETIKLSKFDDEV